MSSSEQNNTTKEQPSNMTTEGQQQQTGQIPMKAQDPMTNLLSWAIENSDMDKLKEEAKKGQTKPIDKKWLDAIFPSEGSKMQRHLEVIEDKNASIEEKESAFDQIEFYVESMDNANDFYKVGGLRVILKVLREESDELKINALSVMGICLQNNPDFQKWAFENNSLPILVDLLSSTAESVQKKAVFALSGLLRQYNDAIQAFSKTEGMKRLCQILKDTNINTKTKTIFLLTSLVTQESSFSSAFFEYDIHPTLVDTFKQGPPVTKEKTLNLIYQLLKVRNDVDKHIQSLADSGMNEAAKEAQTQFESDSDEYSRQILMMVKPLINRMSKLN